jgi:capsid protein
LVLALAQAQKVGWKGKWEVGWRGTWELAERELAERELAERELAGRELAGRESFLGSGCMSFYACQGVSWTWAFHFPWGCLWKAGP